MEDIVHCLSIVHVPTHLPAAQPWRLIMQVRPIICQDIIGNAQAIIMAVMGN